MRDRHATYAYLRDWRRSIALRLKQKLGLWCRGCETPDTPLLANDGPHWLHLVIPNRRSADLAIYGNNTVTIYNQILKGKIPLDRVTLLCDDCHFKLGKEAQ